MATTSHLKRKSKCPRDASTPPMPQTHDSSSSSFDEYDSYFTRTYVPLSNLPTPPPSSHSHSSSRQASPLATSPSSEYLDPELLGPAIHLTNLIPPSLSLLAPSTTHIHALLTRAALPLETVALAVCILDSLSPRFSLSWRLSLPLRTSHQYIPGSFDSSFHSATQHIDSVRPELVVLSALILAVKFVDDEQVRTREYVDTWGEGTWSCEQVNFTERKVLEDLGYRLLGLWEEERLLEALCDMERAGEQARSAPYSSSEEDWENEMNCKEFGEEKGFSTGKAVPGLGAQLTPAETPMPENVRGTKDVDAETRMAFGQ